MINLHERGHNSNRRLLAAGGRARRALAVQPGQLTGLPLPHCSAGASFPAAEVGEQNMLHISGASASLKLRDLKPWFPGTLSDLHMYFKDNVFPSAISACGNLGQRSGRALLKSKDSSLLPNKHTNSAIPLQASFQVATSTMLPLSSLTGCFTGKENTLQAAHFSHSFASPVSLYSHRSFPAHLISLTCFIYLLLYFQLFSSPCHLSSSAPLAWLPFTPYRSLLASSLLHPSHSDPSSSSQALLFAMATHRVLSAL